MVIKSVPMDDMNAIVFAVRGSQTFMDWAVNLHSTPISPEGFLVSPFPKSAYQFVDWFSGRPRELLSRGLSVCCTQNDHTGRSSTSPPNRGIP